MPVPSRSHRWWLSSATAVVTLLPVAGAASAASTVSVEGGVLRVVAAPGENNEVEVSEQNGAQSAKVTSYQVTDIAGTQSGAGCRGGEAVVCPAAGVHQIVVRLGDGDDGATDARDTNNDAAAGPPLDIYGEAGNDRIGHQASKGGPGLTDGGEGNDVISGDDVRGGPGDDNLAGQRLLDGGDGNDVLAKSGFWSARGGRLRGGAGDDILKARDHYADVLECGAGQDLVATTDDADRIDATCEGVTPRAPGAARVTVFELPGAKSRPGRDGRLAVWIKCSVPKCSVTVRMFSVGTPGGTGSRTYVRFPNPPGHHLVAGDTAKLFHIRLNRAQRRGLRRSRVGDGVRTIVIVRRPGADAKLQTDGLYCTRADPCDD